MKKILLLLFISIASFAQSSVLLKTTDKGVKTENCQVNSSSFFSANNYPLKGVIYTNTTGALLTTSYPASTVWLVAEMKTWDGVGFVNIRPAVVPSTNWSELGNTSGTSKKLGTTDATDLKIFTTDIERVVVKANGLVGVGVLVPTEKLDINGNVKFSGDLRPNSLPGVSGQVLTSAGPGVSPTWNTALAPSLGGNIIAYYPKLLTLQDAIFENFKVRWNSALNRIEIATVSGNEIVDCLSSINYGTQSASVNGGAGVEGSPQTTPLSLTTAYQILGDPGIVDIEDRSINIFSATGVHYRLNVLRKGTTITDGWVTFVVYKNGVTTQTVITANNGVNIVSGNLELGTSPLIKNTNIPLSTFNLTTSGTGKVGVGIATPQSNLSVFASQSASGLPQFEISAPSATSGFVYGGLSTTQLNSGGFFIHTALVGGVGHVTSLVGGGNTAGNFPSKMNFLTTATGGVQPLIRLHIAETGNIGIGNITPAAKLDITGTLKIADGTQGAGKVLTSDASGLSSWQALPTAATKVSVICRNKTAQSINSWTLLTNWTEIQDPTNSFNPITASFTAPRAGVYTFTIGDGLQPGNSQYGGLSIRKNGTQLYNTLLNNVTGIMYMSSSGTVELAAGDIVTPYAYSAVAGNDIATASNSWFTIIEQ